MRTALVLPWVWLAACSTSPPAADAGAGQDSGAGDSGSVDAGGVDAGPADAGTADAGPALPCNAVLHVLTDQVRASGGAGALALGLVNASETLILHAGDSVTQPIFLFNQATLAVVAGDGGPTRLSGPVYAMDQSTFRISGANVDVLTGLPFFFGDDATYDVADSGMALGPLSPSLQLEMSCGRSHASIRNTDFTVREISSASIFVRDQSTFTVSGNRGLLEVTLDEGGHLDAVDTTDPAGEVGVYFRVHQPDPITLTLSSGPAMPGPAQQIQLPPDDAGFIQSASITNSNVFYGIWLDPATNLTLTNSALGMFLLYHGDGSASGISGTPGNGPPETRVFPLNDRTLTLQNTRLLPLNIYQDAPSVPGTLTLDHVTIGEHTCSGVAGTRCVLTNSTVDGSGGFLSANGNAELTLQACILQTYLQANDRSVTRLQAGLMERGPAKPSWIVANGEALVSLEDEFLGYPDGGGKPQFILNGSGAIATTTVFLPFTPTVVPHGSALPVDGTVGILTDAGSPFSFDHYAISLEAGGASVLDGGGTAPVSAGVLGDFDPSGLDAGGYVLHVRLFADAGLVSDVTRPIQVQ